MSTKSAAPKTIHLQTHLTPETYTALESLRAKLRGETGQPIHLNKLIAEAVTEYLAKHVTAEVSQ